MNEIEIINYIKTIQEAIIDLQKSSKDHARHLLPLWDATNKSIGLIREQTARYQELQSQLNLVLLFVTKQLSTTERFAEFVADVVEANETCQDRPEMNATHAAAVALLEGGLKNHLPADRLSRPTSPTPLPANVVLFPSRPALRPPEPPAPPETPDSDPRTPRD